MIEITPSGGGLLQALFRVDRKLRLHFPLIASLKIAWTERACMLDLGPIRSDAGCEFELWL